MKVSDIREHLRRYGWMFGAIAACIILCILPVTGNDHTQDTDRRIARVLSEMQGAGKVEVAVVYDNETVPCGAVVIADGASSISVRLRLESAVATLLGLSPDCVAVYQRQGGTP